jgi:hypothetical protein
MAPGSEPPTIEIMRIDELWVESYQGEVFGEALFRLLAQREPDEQRRRQLEALTLLERATKELAEPVFERRALDRGDTAASLAQATELADTIATMSWDEFLASFEPVTDKFIAKYRELVDLTTDGSEREVAEAYVAHEEALAAFARRALGKETGEALQPIFALPHVAALVGS